jgi:hypothetical protein
MTKRTEKVVAGFANLTNEERQDALNDINRLLRAPPREGEELQESFSKRAGIDLGPTGQGGCPCCGQ